MNIRNLRMFILHIGFFGILFSVKVQAMKDVKSDVIHYELIKEFASLNLENENVMFFVE